MANNVIKRTWNQNKMVCIEDLSGMAFQSESGGHTFEISGTDDSGTAVSLSGTVEARFLRADNVKVTIAGTISSGKASVTLTSNCYTVAGRFSLTIFVTSNSQKVAVYSAVGNVAVTDGVSSGTVPPLVTDSIQTGSMTASGNVTVNGVLDVTNRRCEATLSSAGWYRVLTVSGGIGNANRSFAIDINITRTFNDSNNEVHYVKMLKTFNAIPSFENEASKTNSLVVDKIRYTIDSNSNGHLDIRYNASVSNDTAIDFTVHTDYSYQYLFTAANMTYMGTADPANETVLAEYKFTTITGARVVHAQSSTSFGDAIATIKDIIGDNEITWAGNAANNLHNSISSTTNGVVNVPSGGPVFFAIVGKASDSYYAAELFSYNYPWRLRIRYAIGTYYTELYYYPSY